MSEEKAPEINLEEILKTPQVKQQARMLALQFEAITKNWFTVDRILKKCKDETKESVITKLLTVMALDMCVRKEEGGEVKYKITLKPEQKIRFLEGRLEDLEEEKKDIQSEIEKLKG